MGSTLVWREVAPLGEVMPSAAKAVIRRAFTARLKSCPDTKHEFLGSLFSRAVNRESAGLSPALTKDRALSTLAHGRWRLAVHAPIDLRHRPRGALPRSARAESDRGACLCPFPTVQL